MRVEIRMSVKGLERLVVWKKSKDFALEVYREVLSQLLISNAIVKAQRNLAPLYQSTNRLKPIRLKI